MTDLVLSGTQHEVLRVYKDDKLVNGGLVVCWDYDYDHDLIFVGISLCSTAIQFNKKDGRYRAEHKLSDAHESVDTQSNSETSFIVTQNKIIDFIENYGILEEFYRNFSSSIFMSILHGKISDNFSNEFVGGIIISSAVELWHERYDKKNEYTVKRLHERAKNEYCK
jgi:hypothetical protein